MYYLTPKFHVKAIVPPYEDAGHGMERDANGKVFDRSHLTITREEALERGRALCDEQERRIARMTETLRLRRINLAKGES